MFKVLNEETIARGLQDLLIDMGTTLFDDDVETPDGEQLIIVRANDFERFLTRDAGVEIELSDGSKFQISVKQSARGSMPQECADGDGEPVAGGDADFCEGCLEQHELKANNAELARIHRMRS